MRRTTFLVAWMISCAELGAVAAASGGCVDDPGEDDEGRRDDLEPIAENDLDEAAPKHGSPFVSVWAVADDGDDGCGGFFVSPTQIVTAAHCVDGHAASDLRVYDASRIPRFRHAGRPIATLVHPSYVPGLQRPLFDVAVIRLKRASEGPVLTIGADALAPRDATTLHFTRAEVTQDVVRLDEVGCKLAGTIADQPVSVCQDHASSPGDSGLPILVDGKAYLSIIGHHEAGTATRGQNLAHVRAALGI
jgi:hypothetical protein